MLLSAFKALEQLYLQQPLAQSIRLAGLTIGLHAFAQKRDHRLKLLLTPYAVVIGLHFLLMGSYPGAISAWISSIRTWVSRRSNSLKWALSFMVITLILVVPRITSWVFVLPLLGACLGTWALFREQGIRMRTMLMLGTVCWLIHNIAIGSIGGSVIESSFLMMNAATLYRLWQDGGREHIV